MSFGKKEIHFIITGLALVLAVVGAYFGVTLPAPAMPGPEFGPQAIPTQAGPPGDFVSMSYGGQFQDAVKVAVPTANATADIGLYVDNDSVAPAFRVADASTPVFEIRDGGTFLGVLEYDTAGQKIICGTSTITGTGALAHGLSTPTYCVTSLQGDFAADTGFTSCSLSSGTATAKVWKVNSTPTAGSVGVVVAWCVVGTP